jgi:hypothetical protein
LHENEKKRTEIEGIQNIELACEIHSAETPSVILFHTFFSPLVSVFKNSDDEKKSIKHHET